MKDVGKELVVQLAGLRMKFRVAAASKVLCHPRCPAGPSSTGAAYRGGKGARPADCGG